MKHHKCPLCGAALLFDFSASSFSLNTGIAAWIESLELRELSYSYVSNLKQRARDYVIPFFKSIDVRTIRTYHVHQFHVDLLKKRLSSKTVKHILDTLRGFLYHCLQLEQIERMPVFPKVKVVYREKHWMNEHSQGKVLEDIPPAYRAPFEVLFETGIRPGEVRALKKKDLRDSGISIERAYDERGHLKATKTGKSEFKPLSDALYQRLTESAALMFPEAFLFPWARPVNKLYNLWRQVCTSRGLSIPLYQAGRHSRASQKRQELERSSREELRKVLNHTRADTTLKHYALDGGKEVKA